MEQMRLFQYQSRHAVNGSQLGTILSFKMLAFKMFFLVLWILSISTSTCTFGQRYSKAKIENPIASETITGNFLAACVHEISDETLIIQNPGFPLPATESKTYLHDVKILPGMAGLRIKFVNASLARNFLTNSCTSDFIYLFKDGTKTQPNCGVLSNFQTSVPTKSGQIVSIVIGVQSREARWKIEVQQIKEEDVHKSQKLLGEQDACGQPKEVQELSSEDLPSWTHPISFIDPMCNVASTSLKCRLQNFLLSLYKSQRFGSSADDDDRIINGENAKRGSFPWMVALFIGPSFFCGGTVVSKHTVLTAGHCAATVQAKYTVSQLTAVIGSTNLSSRGPGVQILTPDYISYHAQYSEIFNDIAALHFKEEIVFNDAVAPVCLPSLPAPTFDKDMGYISGWGKTADTGNPSILLQHAELPISDNKKCKKAWDEITGEPNNSLIYDNNICAGGQNSATCNGDSGGPLHIKDKKTDKYVQVGIVSFGPASSCYPQKGKPLSVFARVSSFLKDLYLWNAEGRPLGPHAMTYISC